MDSQDKTEEITTETETGSETETPTKKTKRSVRSDAQIKALEEARKKGAVAIKQNAEKRKLDREQKAKEDARILAEAREQKQNTPPEDDEILAVKRTEENTTTVNSIGVLDATSINNIIDEKLAVIKPKQKYKLINGMYVLNP